MTQDRGFSLVELLVAVTLLAVLTGLAVPAFHDLLQRNRVTAHVNLLFTHIQLARIRAVMDAVTVVICPTQDGITCVADNTVWSQGWMVFKDRNYGHPPILDPDDQLLIVHQGDALATSVRSSLNHIRYSPSGYASNGTFTVCGPAGVRAARAIIINIVGRARVSSIAPDGSALICSDPP